MLRRATTQAAAGLWRARAAQGGGGGVSIGRGWARQCASAGAHAHADPKPGAVGEAKPEAAGGDDGAVDAEGGDGGATAALAEKDAAIAALNDRVLRGLAEMENVRAIARRDVEGARDFGIAKFARGLLDVADNLGLALRAVPPEDLEAGGVLQGLHQGVEATERELHKVLRQHGVEKFGEKGDVFDPNRHQALFETPADDVEPGVVVDVTKTGYAIKDRVLRPAEVGVSKAA